MWDAISALGKVYGCSSKDDSRGGVNRHKGEVMDNASMTVFLNGIRKMGVLDGQKKYKRMVNDLYSSV